MTALDDVNETNAAREVADRFMDLIGALNTKDVTAWEEHYGTDEFTSAVAGGETFASREAWVQAVRSLFSLREHQHVTLHDVQVVPLAHDVVMLTSQDTTEMRLKGEERSRYRHVFTMIWKRGPEGWRILHSHESWVDESAN